MTETLTFIAVTVTSTTSTFAVSTDRALACREYSVCVGYAGAVASVVYDDRWTDQSELSHHIIR